MVEDALWSPSPFRTSALAPGSDRACGLAGISQQNGHSRIVRIRRARLLPIVASIACAEGVPTALLDALIIQESRYNSAAVSLRGAMGLTQLMPGTARAMGIVNPWSALQNLKGGARYLKQQLDAFGRYDLALAAYNAGPGQVRRYKGVPPFRETRDYVRSVLGILLEGRARAALSFSGAKRPMTTVKRVELKTFSGRPVTSTRK
ncbi:MAG: lytic transglycosylase domain-containing protein [Pseudomonadota bacterium]